jgi:hypothetical protein
MPDDGQPPLLRLLPPRTLVRRRRQPSFPPPPGRVPQEHAAVLRSGADSVLRHLSEAVGRFPQLATDVPYVRVRPAAGAILTDEELKSLGLIPVYRREDAVLAAYSPQRDLRTFDSQLDSYARQRKKLAALAKIETIGPWSRGDRISRRLQSLGTIESDRRYTVDLLLLPIDGAPANPQALPAIQQYLTDQGGNIVDQAVEPTFTALRVRLGGQALNGLLDYRDDIALVDLPPMAHVLVPEIMSLTLDDIADVPVPDSTAPALCVVDSGILEGHPLLEAAILSDLSRSFPSDLGPPVPAPPVQGAGHGTQVAGIALYYDVGAAAHNRTFDPKLWLINARFLDDGANLHPDRMPFLREVVNHVRRRCRVFNLSFGLEPCEGVLSVHAAELDALTREFDTLFVVSAGNVDAASYFSGKPPKDYPDFLNDSGWTVLSPSEGLNVLTVGGITPDRDPYPNDKYHRAIAPKRAPAPFSRSGGIKNVVKPELVEVAGNLAYDDSIKHWIENDPGLRVPTTNHRFAEGPLLGMVHGTSFAAPKVTHLATKILERYPEASVNLLRALLVQSARFPDGVSEWAPKEILRLCGFGVPDLDRAIYCSPQRATLYYEGEIAMDEVKLFEIPVPEEFSRAKGRKSLYVTMAYDPPVSVVHRDRPAGVNITWGLARGDVSERDVQAAIAAEAEAEIETVESETKEEKVAKRIFMQGKLPKRQQLRGTIQKNEFTWSRGAYGDIYRLAVTAKAVRPAHIRVRQRFAIAVTLECADNLVNVYNAVRTRLAAGRVRVRVKT